MAKDKSKKISAGGVKGSVMREANSTETKKNITADLAGHGFGKSKKGK